MPASYKALLVRTADEGFDDELGAAWERLRATAEAATPYSSIPFARAVASALGYELAFVGARDGEGELAGGLWCYVGRMGPYRRIVVPPFVPYTPLLLRESLSESEVHAGGSPMQVILDVLKSTFHGCALHLLPDHRDLRPASWSGFDVRPLYTYHVTLNDPEELHSTWSENVVRAYLRYQDQYEVESGSEHARNVVDLAERSYHHHGRRFPVGSTALVPLVGTLCELGVARVFSLISKERARAEAGIVVLQEGGTAHYWIAGSHRGPAMTVLLGQVLHRLAAEGLSCFDLVGANTPSIAEFKRKFGSELVSYFRVEHTRSMGLRALDLIRGRRP